MVYHFIIILLYIIIICCVATSLHYNADLVVTILCIYHKINANKHEEVYLSSKARLS